MTHPRYTTQARGGRIPMRYAAFLILAGCCSSPLVKPVDRPAVPATGPGSLPAASTDSTNLTGGEPPASPPALSPSLQPSECVKPPVPTVCVCNGDECRLVPATDLRSPREPMFFSEPEAVPTGMFSVAPVTTTRGSLKARCPDCIDFCGPLSSGLIVVLTVLAFAGLVLFNRRVRHVP